MRSGLSSAEHMCKQHAKIGHGHDSSVAAANMVRIADIPLWL